MILSHRIALDPTNVQATYFAKACGIARLAYNWGLAEWKEQYALGGKPRERELHRLFNAIKGERFPFVREVTKCAPQRALANLGAAFTNFFAGRTRHPVFKKKGIHDSFEIDNDEFEIRPHGIRMPKLGWVRMRESVRFVGKLISATISRTAGRWFASIAMEIPDPTPAPREPASVGIDFGCTTFAALSTGEKIQGPKPHKALLDRLRRLNRSLHRKVKGSRNRWKAKAKLSRLHARIANVRRDFLHKFTTDICRRFTVIGIEDLNVSGLSKNHALARSILDGAPYEMRRQLAYKAPMHGSVLDVADRFFPSSKTCNECGIKVDSLPLSIREWTCVGCGAIHDRDVNAALNLECIAASSAVTACGEGSAGRRAVAASVKLTSVKQEPNAGNSSGILG